MSSLAKQIDKTFNVTPTGDNLEIRFSGIAAAKYLEMGPDYRAHIHPKISIWH